MRLNKTLRNVTPSFISRKIFPPALCLLFFTFPAFAQGDVTFIGSDNIGMDVSFQFSAIKRPEMIFFSGIGGIGGRVGYYLGSGVFLDGEILHQFTGGLTEPYDNEKMTALGGVRFGTIFDDWIGVFAKARVGAFGFNAENKYETLTSAKNFYPVFDVGVIVERYFERNFFVRLDLGDWIIPFGDTKIVHNYYGDGPEHPLIDTQYTRIGTRHNFAVSFGFGFRF